MTKSTLLNLSDLVNAHAEALYSWALHKVSDTELAKDLVQDTFLAAAEKIDSFKGDSTPKTWLFSILNYKIIDIYRKRMSSPSGSNETDMSRYFDTEGSWLEGHSHGIWSSENESVNLLDDPDFQKVLNNCLDDLPPKWNTGIKLKYLFGKNGDEICQELDISTTNYWQLIHRAKMQLRDCVGVNWFND